jgi:hypothetical protein
MSCVPKPSSATTGGTAMGIDVNWYDDTKTALLVVYGKTFELKDFYNSIDISYQLMESVPWTVDIVQDVSELAKLPSNVLSVVRYLEGKSHPRRGVTIIVGINRFVKIMFDVGKTLAPKASANYHFVDTRKDADKLLASVRQSRNERTT